MLDMHNHHSIGDIRHAVNPTSPYRMQMIVESAIAASVVAKDVDVSSKVCGGAVGGAGTAIGAVGGAGATGGAVEDDLASLLSGMDIAQDDQDASLKKFCCCTRKCATKKCPCFSSNLVCNELCHKHNNNCTNY